MNLNMRFKNGTRKALTLSYDDGVVQDIRLSNLLNKHGIKATFHINSETFIPEDAVRERFYGRMKLSEAKAAYVGHEVAVHTRTHPYIAQLRGADVLTETLFDRKKIEQDFGTIVRGMSYPYGCYNEEIISLLKASGIVYSRTTSSTGTFNICNDWHRLAPTCHHSSPKLMELAEKFVNDGPRTSCVNWLFYVWGHSYEFDDANNWEIIEEFAKYIGGKDDIWYATNIEIYDYIAAYKALQSTIDNNIVYNPSAISVWFEANGKTYEIKPNETLYL